ncbi:3-oxoacyl-reductase FabG [Achaetomium macrosporum]|uniref:3-oxoacyl-reductase FabG n=1 Tax=Achaetomium macrosporum TaxID=79813 RepID=A0AAN7CBC3_9PEZI|nr:3-oxoacyl-reductase FabG [Achaetomium macrosporum]
MSPASLVGKTAVITGATRGIGFAIAQRLALEGASVVLAARTVSKLEAARSKMQLGIPLVAGSEKPEVLQPHSIFPLNVREEKGWKSLVEDHPKIDILVNCAGMAQKSLLVRMSEGQIQELVDVNLHGAILGCKIVGKQMISRRRGGCIINVSSLLALRGSIGTSVYAATKAGQLGLTTALSQEYGRYGIRVNALVPGYVHSDMTRDLADKDELIERIPLRRFGNADEVADATAFLAKNEYANNCILHIDGGLSAV